MNVKASNDSVMSAQDVGNGAHAVVLLHGLCGSALELGSVQKALQNNGCTVVALEVPGYSASLTVPGETPDWLAWCEFVEAEIARLKEQFETVSICGLSMGATLALAVAARGDHVSSMVLLSPVLYYDGWSVPWYHKLLGLAFRLGFRDWTYKECEPYGIKNLAMRRRVINALKKDGVAAVGAAEIPARQLWAALQLMAHVRELLPLVRTRAMVMHSVDDETASPRGAELILEKIASETRRAIWLGDCYHIITVDNEREIVTNETVQFLKRDVDRAGKDPPRIEPLQRLALKDRRSPRSAAFSVSRALNR